MTSLDDKIRDLGQNRNLDDLKILIDKTSVEELIELVNTKLNQPNFNYTWNYLLTAYSNSNNSHAKRLKVTLELLNQLETKDVPSSQAIVLLQRLCMEFNKFKSADIAKLCDFCRESIQSKTTTQTSWKEILPELLNVLVERDYFEYDELEYTGTEYKSQFINTLCMTPWSPNIITLLTAAFIEMPLSKEEHLTIVNKLAQYIEKMTPQEIPSLIYQLLRLCKNRNIRSVFLRLQHYFGLIIYDLARDFENDSDSPGLDAIESTLNQDTIDAESTVLFHIHASASLGHECIRDYLNSLKSVVKSPEFILHPFQLTLLFTISTIPYYEETVFDLIRPCVVRFYQEEMKKYHSAWFREMQIVNYSLEQVFGKVIHFSLTDRELTLQALVNFAFVLLGVGAGLGRDIVAEKQWVLGTMILLKIIKRKRLIAPTIIQTISNSILIGQNVGHYIECLHILSKTMPLLMLENQSCVIELMEGLVQVPGNIASQLLDAVIPLTKVSPTIRDHLILLLRKALYSRVVETRQMAVTGFLKLITTLKITNLLVLSQSSNSTGSFTSGHSLYTQLSLNRSSQLNVSSAFTNEALCLEILGILKRCLMQQAEVKFKLYEGLYNALGLNIELGEPVLELLWSHFKFFYNANEEGLPPINLDATVVIKEVEAVLQEPLGKLVLSIGLIITKLKEAEDPIDVSKYETIMDSLCERMAKCELVHFELDDGTDLTDNLPECQKKVLILKEAMNVCDALIGYKILSWKQHSENNAQCIVNLFQAYLLFQNFAKNLGKPKKGAKKKADADKTTQQTNVNNPQKAKSLKLPESLWNFNIIIKTLSLLNEKKLSWATPAEANIVKIKPEFHRHAINATMGYVSSLKHLKEIDSSISKIHYSHLTDISVIIFENIVKKLSEFFDFDCACGILALECFYSILNIITSQYKSNFESFLKKTCNNEGSIETVLREIIGIFQRLLETEEDDISMDPEVKKMANILVNTIHVLSNQIPLTSSILSNELLDSLKNYAQTNKLNSKMSMSFINLLFEMTIKCKVSLQIFEHMSVNIGSIVGVISEEEQDTENFEMVNEGTVLNLLTCLCHSVKTILEDVDAIVVRLKSEFNVITYPGEDNIEKKRDQLKNKERGVCCQLCFVVQILSNLCNLTVQPGNMSEAIFKNIIMLFSTLSSLSKYFMARSNKQNPAFQGAKFERLVKLAGKQLAPVVYKFILHVEESQKEGPKATQAKKKAVDSSTLKSRVLRETRLIPKVVYEMEQFSKCVTQLTNKTKIDLTKYVGQGIARDFRIVQLKEVLEQAGEMDVTMETQNSDQANESISNENEVSHVESENDRDSDKENDKETDKENGSDEECSPPPNKRSKT